MLIKVLIARAGRLFTQKFLLLSLLTGVAVPISLAIMSEVKIYSIESEGLTIPQTEKERIRGFFSSQMWIGVLISQTAIIIATLAHGETRSQSRVLEAAVRERLLDTPATDPQYLALSSLVETESI